MTILMKYSKNGLKLTENFESCELTAYTDHKGVWTIGWGHTGSAVVHGLVWTQEQADKQLLLDIAWAEHVVNYEVRPQLDQNEFDALVDFVFNVGSGLFQKSTMLVLLNNGRYDLASIEFDRFRFCGGVALAGLLRRRVAETALFDTV